VNRSHRRTVAVNGTQQLPSCVPYRLHRTDYTAIYVNVLPFVFEHIRVGYTYWLPVRVSDHVCVRVTIRAVVYPY
jgi:hypothetical protein